MANAVFVLSSCRACSFHIGAPEDYDEWVQLQKGQPGAEQWAFKEFNK